jgi:hypothetical protein
VLQGVAVFRQVLQRLGLLPVDGDPRYVAQALDRSLGPAALEVPALEVLPGRPAGVLEDEGPVLAQQTGVEEHLDRGLQVQDGVLEVPGSDVRCVLVQVLDNTGEVVDAVADRRKVQLRRSGRTLRRHEPEPLRCRNLPLRCVA